MSTVSGHALSNGTVEDTNGGVVRGGSGQRGTVAKETRGVPGGGGSGGGRSPVGSGPRSTPDRGMRDVVHRVATSDVESLVLRIDGRAGDSCGCGI